MHESWVQKYSHIGFTPCYIPVTRPRTDHGDNDTPGSRGDADEDPITIFSDAEDFYDALRQELKAGKAIDFHGTYPVLAEAMMYTFCVKHKLPEVWAYLWENWYRRSRWELWARSVHAEIPVMKTTMMLESHWRRIKHDFLHHFHMPRCDLLAWILILSAWRKDFKRAWRRLEKTPITLPVNPAYKTDVKKGVCTCPSLAISRFLICKHFVQAVQPVPPVFFLEVKRQRTAPFWVHPTLRSLSDNSARDTDAISGPADGQAARVDTAADELMDVDEDDDDDVVDTQPDNGGRTFVEAMDENIDLIVEFAKGLKYQRQFRDQRMLQTLEREGASFLRLARACLTKEKRLTSTRGPAPSTWDKSTGTAMFYRARPAASDEARR
ncbi:hypothetical protein C8R45DRAFT_1051083 [Mycena sanguinolenta]|nr:hypothetical protein C8R45DRAFT_1051083 [Mycena sanguinolenta]